MVGVLFVFFLFCFVLFLQLPFVRLISLLLLAKHPSPAACCSKANTPETSGGWKGKFVLFRKVVG